MSYRSTLGQRVLNGCGCIALSGTLVICAGFLLIFTRDAPSEHPQALAAQAASSPRPSLAPVAVPESVRGAVGTAFQAHPLETLCCAPHLFPAATVPSLPRRNPPISLPAARKPSVAKARPKRPINIYLFDDIKIFIKIYGAPNRQSSLPTREIAYYNDEKVMAIYILEGRPRRWHVAFRDTATGKTIDRNEVRRRMAHRERDVELAADPKPPRVEAPPKKEAPRPLPPIASKAPKTKKGPNGEDMIFVEGYTRKDGKRVEGYWRHAPKRKK